jgi:hypothetical protein
VIVVSELARSSRFFCRLLDLAVELETGDAVLLAGPYGHGAPHTAIPLRAFAY